jgi:hypothetical protein
MENENQKLDPQQPSTLPELNKERLKITNSYPTNKQKLKLPLLVIGFFLLIIFLWIAFDTFTSLNKAFIYPTTGSNPLHVKIKIPNKYKFFVYSPCIFHPFGFTGKTFNVDWGDGNSSSNKNCLEHTYTVPGTYKVVARIYNYSDIPEFNGQFTKDIWKDEGTVVVTGIANKSYIKITSLDPDKNKLFYFEEFPQVNWHVSANKGYSIIAEIVDEKDIVLVSRTQNDISYIGEGRSIVTPDAEEKEKYYSSLKAGQKHFKVRLKLIDDSGKVVSQDESAWLNITSENNPSYKYHGEFTPIKGKAPLTIKIYYDAVWDQKCFAYAIDWGDGSPKEIKKPDIDIKAPGATCDINKTDYTVLHTYKKPGTYTVIWKDSLFNEFKTLDEIVNYSKRVITIY